MRIDTSLEKARMLGKIERKRRREHQSMRWLDSIIGAMNMNLVNSDDDEGQRCPACCSLADHKEFDTAGWLNNSNN